MLIPTAIYRYPCFDIAAVPAFHSRLHALEFQRGECLYIHYASHSVSAIERVLWSAQNRYPTDVAEHEVVGVLVQIGDAVYIEAHGRLVDARSQPSNVYRGGHACSIVGNVEIGCPCRHLLNVGDAQFLRFLAVHDGVGNGSKVAGRRPAAKRCFHHNLRHVCGRT